jgi:hypothetical protein
MRRGPRLSSFVYRYALVLYIFQCLYINWAYWTIAGQVYSPLAEVIDLSSSRGEQFQRVLSECKGSNSMEPSITKAVVNHDRLSSTISDGFSQSSAALNKACRLVDDSDGRRSFLRISVQDRDANSLLLC